MPESALSRRSIDSLSDDIVSLAQKLNAAEYEFLVLVREFDIRQGWRAWHHNNCAEWLNMKCGISLGAAREKVRVALALLDLPETAAAFRDGVLSYSKVRAITRAADVANEAELLDFARYATASQVEDHCRQVRNASRRLSTRDANRAHRSRYMIRSLHDDGTMTVTLQVSAEEGALLMKAVEVAMNRNADETDACDDAETGDFFRRQADGMIEVARDYLAGGRGENGRSSSADRYQVMVHVDESALSDETGKSDLPVESVRRLTCDGSVVTVSKDGHAAAKKRTVSPPLKRALFARDRRCRFPGCSHDRHLDAHHVMHWADGGATTKDNLLLLCSRHHRLLHEGGFTIQKDYRGEWYFRANNGRVLPDASRDALALTCGETHSDRIESPQPRYWATGGFRAAAAGSISRTLSSRSPCPCEAEARPRRLPAERYNSQWHYGPSGRVDADRSRFARRLAT